jgi:DNA polymerase-3 subunit delta
MIYLIHGDEEFLRSEALQRRKEALDSPDTADLNTVRLDGRKTTLSELRHACDTVPFLAPRRLVIVDSLLGRPAGRAGKQTESQKEYLQGVLRYLDQVPETADLVLMEDVLVKRGHPLYAKLQSLAKSKQAHMELCGRMQGYELEKWTEARTRAKGGQITRDTTQELIRTVGDNLRLLDQELEKLVAYTAGRRSILPADVQLLVPQAREEKIWDMVDALGERRGRQAITSLHRLLEDGAHPLYVLTMIVRQYRILLQVKDLTARGLRSSAIAKELKMRDFVVEKMVRQARLYSLPQLEAIYARLLETDLAIKTGEMDGVLALDVLVAELAQQPDGRSRDR